MEQITITTISYDGQQYKKNENLYSAGENNLNTIVLDVVDEVMDGKPVALIRKIMEYMPNDITVSAEEISKIAGSSGKYKLHFNGAVLIRTRNQQSGNMSRVKF